MGTLNHGEFGSDLAEKTTQSPRAPVRSLQDASLPCCPALGHSQSRQARSGPGVHGRCHRRRDLWVSSEEGCPGCSCSAAGLLRLPCSSSGGLARLLRLPPGPCSDCHPVWRTRQPGLLLLLLPCEAERSRGSVL